MARSVSDATDRYGAIMDQVKGLIPLDLYLELDNAAMDYVGAMRLEVLNNLVIGVYDAASFPVIEHAIFTRDAGELQIDECDHRNTARNAAYAREDGRTDLADRYELLARAALERDLGHQEEGQRLLSEVRS